MNKFSFFIFILILLVLTFTLGYKVGDSRGYADGYNEGYLYDCKAELKLLDERVKAQKKMTDFANKSVREVIRRNDSLRRAMGSYQADSIKDYNRRRAKWELDSSLYWEVSARKNDSLVKYLGFKGHRNLIKENGQANEFACLLLYKDTFGKLRECTDPTWRAYR